MKRSQIDHCLRLYRKSITLYAELVEKLRTAQSATGKYSELQRTTRRLAQAADDLDHLGECLAVVPELVEQLRERLQMEEAMRDQAAQAGIVFRFAVPGPAREDGDDDAEDFGDEARAPTPGGR